MGQLNRVISEVIIKWYSYYNSFRDPLVTSSTTPPTATDLFCLDQYQSHNKLVYLPAFSDQKKLDVFWNIISPLPSTKEAGHSFKKCSKAIRMQMITNLDKSKFSLIDNQNENTILTKATLLSCVKHFKMLIWSLNIYSSRKKVLVRI